MYSAATFGRSSQLTVAAALMINDDAKEEEMEEEFRGSSDDEDDREHYLLIETSRIFRSFLLKQLARFVQQGSRCLWLVHLHNKLHCYR